jgi:hypothetical protein
MLTCVGFLVWFQCRPVDQAHISEARFCRTARPIVWSSTDHPETIRKVREHNSVGRALCGWGSEPPAK